MKPIGRTELRRFLRQLPKEQLINQVVDLCESFPAVRDYYQAKVHPADDRSVRQKYRQIIEREFFPPRGMGKMRLSVARKAVMDYKNLAASLDGVADLMLAYVENGVRFTNTYGDIDEPFYLSMERMYASALQWIVKHQLEAEFAERCAQIVEAAYNTGWGFYDGLLYLYNEHLGARA